MTDKEDRISGSPNIPLDLKWQNMDGNTIQDMPNLIMTDIKQEVMDEVSNNLKVKDEFVPISYTSDHKGSQVKIEMDETMEEHQTMMKDEMLNDNGSDNFLLKNEEIYIECNDEIRGNSSFIDRKNEDRHLQVDIFKCHYCNHETIEKVNLNRHLLLVHRNLVEVDRFKCDRCEFQTNRRWSLNTHLLKHKNSEEGLTLKCSQCDYQTSKKYHLKKHLLVQHGMFDDDNMFKCTQCDYKTTRRYNLKTRQLRHKNLLILKCEQCHYQAIEEADLKIHLLQHRYSKVVGAFKCDQCEFVTIYKHSFNLHLLRHTQPGEGDTVKCPECEYRTIERSNLKKHLLRHKKREEAEMFKCDRCEYETFRKDTLNRHIRRHKTRATAGDSRLFGKICPK